MITLEQIEAVAAKIVSDYTDNEGNRSVTYCIRAGLDTVNIRVPRPEELETKIQSIPLWDGGVRCAETVLFPDTLEMDEVVCLTHHFADNLEALAYLPMVAVSSPKAQEFLRFALKVA